MKLSWLTDLHLNFLKPKARAAFIESVGITRPDAVLLGGDVDEASEVATTLETLARAWRVPVYFVLGNHDFYHGSIEAVRAEVTTLVERVPNLVYLSVADPVYLPGGTALLGVDGWGDGGFGNAADSPVQLNDFVLIDELCNVPRGPGRLAVCRALGQDSAVHLRHCLEPALTSSRQIIVLTHVPPFQEATWHEGKMSGEDWLPWFACRATGEFLRDVMAAHPDKEMLVLCGHTHGAGETEVLPNLRVLTGGAEYGRPRVQRIIEVPSASA